MSDVINLRRARKKKVRAERDAAAAENRAAFGRTKAQKLKDDVVRRRDEAFIDGHRRPSADDDEGAV
ncbi:MAG: DUF4169 family protein [Pseudomonadota bacterium]